VAQGIHLGTRENFPQQYLANARRVPIEGFLGRAVSAQADFQVSSACAGGVTLATSSMVVWPWPAEVIKLSDSVLSPIGLSGIFTDHFLPIDPSSSTGIGNTMPSLPLMDGNGFVFQMILGYIILALMPKAAMMVKDALSVKPFKYESAFGEAGRPIQKAADLPADLSMSYLSSRYENTDKDPNASQDARARSTIAKGFVDTLNNFRKSR
jgi:hypothetical protein